MLGSFKKSVGRAARQAALAIWAGLFLLVGLGFLTAALWLYLAATQTVLFATVVVGLIYTGLALILLGLARMGGKAPAADERPERPATDGRAPFPPVTEAFLFGLDAGLKSAGRRPPKPDVTAGTQQ
ncbi:MAG: phage holin family protein [Paracoccaceae bacterium]